MAEAAAITVACAQMRSGVDPAANVAAASDLIREAAAGGATFIATPEMTTAIDRDADRLRAGLPVGEPLTEVDAFANLADALSVWLLIGSMPVRLDERRIANRAFLFAPDGRIAARYDKIHMFDVSLPDGESWRESAIYEPGDAAIVADTPLGPTGLTICYDIRFPALYRRLAQAGATAFCAPAAFTRQTGEAHWSTLLRARAIENGAFVVAPAQGGRHEDGRETYGHSMVVDPWGRVLGELGHDDPGVLLADIDPSAAAEARRRIPSLGLDRAREVDIFKS